MSLICQIGLDQITIPANKTDDTFSEKNIEEGAESILALGGLIRPIIVQRLNYETYELVSGDFELAAMLKAQELDPTFETIECFICGDNKLLKDLDQKDLKKAIQIFNYRPFSTHMVVTKTETERDKGKNKTTAKTDSKTIKSLIVAFLTGKESATIKEVYLYLLDQGYELDRKKVGQRLAYLTKKGVLTRPRSTRGVYSMAK